MRKIIKKVHLLLTSIGNLFRRGSIAVNVYQEEKDGVILHKNWGDDLNIHLLKLLTGKHIYAANKSILHNKFTLKNYSCIGSIIGFYENERTEIWGSGFISNQSDIRTKPAKIHSVRGKLTRKMLLSQGIDCPEKYGDPALLVSRYYKAQPIGRYRLGIIPHYVDLSNEIVKRIISEREDVILIDIAHYDKWTDVCDMVVSCDYIISSSLHGLIVSDSYGIPNIWARFSNKVCGGNFKFLDYFSSVEREEIEPILIDKIDVFDYIEIQIKDKIKCNAKFDLDAILSSCPFYH